METPPRTLMTLAGEIRNRIFRFARLGNEEPTDYFCSCLGNLCVLSLPRNRCRHGKGVLKTTYPLLGVSRQVRREVLAMGRILRNLMLL